MKKSDILKVEVFTSKETNQNVYWVYRNIYLDGRAFLTHKYSDETVPKTVLYFIALNDNPKIDDGGNTTWKTYVKE